MITRRKKQRNPSLSRRERRGEELKITPLTRVSEILSLLPHAVPLLAEYGLHCTNCAFNVIETLHAGCKSHGFSDEDIDQLVVDLNELLRSLPKRPQTITVTKAAAENLLLILQVESSQSPLSHGERNGEGPKKISPTSYPVLSVEMDHAGNFCMEFRPAPAVDDRIFHHPDIPAVRVAASPAALQRVGGATIDFREGRFKLDMPTAVPSACACCSPLLMGERSSEAGGERG